MLCFCSAAISLGMGMITGKKKNPQKVGRVTEGFQLTAVAEKELVKSGTAARLRIRIKNITNRPLYLAEMGTEKDYKVRIWNDSGKPISLTEHGKVLQNTEGDVYMNLSLVIQPGQEREDTLEIGKIYEMTTPGNYWVIVERKVGKLAGKGVAQAESNTVRIKVVMK